MRFLLLFLVLCPGLLTGQTLDQQIKQADDAGAVSMDQRRSLTGIKELTVAIGGSGVPELERVTDAMTRSLVGDGWQYLTQLFSDYALVVNRPLPSTPPEWVEYLKSNPARPELVLSVNATCADTSAGDLPALPPLPGTASVEDWNATHGSLGGLTSAGLAQQEAYNAFIIARARAAGEKLIPAMCALRVSLLLNQVISVRTPGAPTDVPVSAVTWSKLNVALVKRSEVLEKARQAITPMYQDFASDFRSANPRQ